MNVIAEIKSRLTITDLVGEMVDLSNNKGFCPFHPNTKTAAFAVFPHTQTWRCFGACDEGGDIFDYWQKLNNCDFTTALTELANKAGIVLDDSPEAKERRAKEAEAKQLYNDFADFYINELSWSHQAQDYLRVRGLHRVIDSGLVGYTDGSTLAIKYHQAIEHHITTEGGYNPLNGLVYICRDINGTPVDFESRSITEKKHRRVGPKHPFWALYHRGGQLVVVEGPADALTWYQQGFNALALNGVNVAGVNQADIARFDQVFYVADQDEAGQATLAKIGEELGPLTNIATITHEGVKDSNDLLIAEPSLAAFNFTELLKQSQPYLNRLINEAKGEQGTKFDGAIIHIMQQVAKLPEPAQIRYKETICKELPLTRSAYNQYLKLIEPEPEQPSSDDDIVLEFNLNREKYRVIHGKTIHIRPEKSGQNQYELLIEAHFEIEKIIKRLGSEEQTELLIACQNGRNMGKARVPIEDFDKMRWITQNWPTLGITAPQRVNADYLREAIQVLSKPKEAYIYERLGHAKIDGQRCFLMNNNILGYEGEKDVTVDISLGRENSNLSLFKLPAQPVNVVEAWRFSLSLWDKLGDVGILMWAATHTAPLIPLLNPTFLVMLYARTNSFKSTISGIFQSFFGDWGNYSSKDAWKFLPGSFRTTMHGIIKNAYLAKDVLYVVDDFFPRKGNELGKMTQILVELIRAAGNQAGRDRMSGSTAFHKHSDRPRCLTIVTAEELPTQLLEESDLARVVGCPLKEWQKDDQSTESFMATLTDIYDNATQLQNAMSSYILFVLQNYDEIEQYIAEIEQNNLAIFNKSRYPRQPESFSKLLTAVTIGLNCAVAYGAITEAEAEQRQHQAEQTLNRMMEDYGLNIQGVDPVERFIEALREHLDDDWILAAGQIGKGGLEGEIKIPYGHYHAGYLDERYIYLKPSYFRKILSDKDNPINLGANTMYKRLSERGWLIKRGEESSFSEYVKHKSKTVRLIHIPVHVVYPEEENSI